MREVTYYVATSLDGFIAAPGGDWLDAFPPEGDHMQAVLHDYTDALPGHILRALGLTSERTLFDTVVMGWNTYAPALAEGIRSPYPHLAQVVATRQTREVPDEITTTDDPVATLRALRELPGSGIWLAGGGELAGAVVDEIDRLVLKINPVVLGEGVPLFAGASYTARRFERVGLRTFESGVMIAEFTRRR